MDDSSNLRLTAVIEYFNHDSTLSIIDCYFDIYSALILVNVYCIARNF